MNSCSKWDDVGFDLTCFTVCVWGISGIMPHTVCLIQHTVSFSLYFDFFVVVLWFPMGFMWSSEAMISNYNHYKVWDEITYPFSNFNGGTVEVWDWMCNFIPRFIMEVITYSWAKLIHVSKRDPWGKFHRQCWRQQSQNDLWKLRIYDYGESLKGQYQNRCQLRMAYHVFPIYI